MADKQSVDPSTLELAMLPSYYTPTTGATVTLTQGRHLKVVLNPAGTLLALTLAFPSSPLDGDIVNFTSSQAVTTFSITNATIVGPLTTLSAATFAAYMYSATAVKWFRIG